MNLWLFAFKRKNGEAKVYDDERLCCCMRCGDKQKVESPNENWVIIAIVLM